MSNRQHAARSPQAARLTRAARFTRVAGSGLSLLVALAAAAAPAFAQTPQLGSIEFPTSGSEEAQQHFVQGVLLMHNFEYEDAGTHFWKAQEADPDFAMAYWGEAMAVNHAIWQRQDTEQAVAILNRLAATPEERAAKAGTELEKRWLHAADVLFGTAAPGKGRSKQERDDLYREEMRRLYEDYPDDHEVATFYALSILGTAHEGRDFATYMRAAAVARPVFDANPEHPGAAHYLIHSFDDPVHAPLGLPMARAYSTIAPAAGHAQHMTSHIFVAMGMWDDVVSANETARDVQNQRQHWLDRPPVVCGHYTYWLEYGYLQQGRYQDARRVLDTCYERIQSGASASEMEYFADMRARYFFDSGDESAATRYTAEWDTPNYNYLIVNAVAAGINGDLETARKIHQVMQEGLEEGRAASANGAASGAASAAATSDAATSDAPPTIDQVLTASMEGGLAMWSGDVDRAAEVIAEVAEMEARMPYEFGPPAVVKPMYELLGEFLSIAGRHEEAAQAFQTQLDRTPMRTGSMLGLARSAQATGNHVVAKEAYAALAQIWSAADAGIDGLEEAKTAEADGAPDAAAPRESGSPGGALP